MTALSDLLPVGWENFETQDFVPCATYYPPMDCIIYLREDSSYRADRVDEFMTVLWHPYEERAIGVKLKGGRFLFERIRAIMAPLGCNLDDDDFLPLMSALQLALSLRGDTVTDKAEQSRIERQKRRADMYSRAIEIVGDATIDTRQLAFAS